MDNWFGLILGSAVLLGIYDLCKKHAVRDNSVMPVLFFATLCGSATYVALAALSGKLPAIAVCDAARFGLIFLKSLLVAASWTCVYYAMRELPISIAAPVRASAPVWTLIGAVILFGEMPTWLQGVAMALIFGGYYLFSVAGKREGISFRSSRGIHLILLGTLLGAASALYDKYLLGVLKIPHGTVQFYFSLDLVLILGLAYAARRFCWGNQRPFVWRWTIPATGVLLIFADSLYFYALSQPDVQVSILSLVRRCGCVVAFTAGVFLFRDRNVLPKALALTLILAGIVLLGVAR